MMKSNYVIVSIKLFLGIGYNEYINTILCNFGAQIMTAVTWSKIKPSLNSVNR